MLTNPLGVTETQTECKRSACVANTGVPWSQPRLEWVPGRPCRRGACESVLCRGHSGSVFSPLSFLTALFVPLAPHTQQRRRQQQKCGLESALCFRTRERIILLTGLLISPNCSLCQVIKNRQTRGRLNFGSPVPSGKTHQAN